MSDREPGRHAAVDGTPSLPEGLQPSRRVPVLRVGRASSGRVEDVTAVEEPLEVRLHGRPFAVIMRTPGADRELAAGFLLAEQAIRSSADLGAVEHCRHPRQPDRHNVVDVYLLGSAAAGLERMLEQRRNVLASSSCGLCGRVTIDSLTADVPPLDPSNEAGAFDARTLARLPARLRERQQIFQRTGGLHGAAIFGADAACHASAEDVGRHNAVDKVVGTLLLGDRPAPRPSALAVSGRVSFEIVQKAWFAGIGLVCAVSAPSSLAVELAGSCGITLVAFVRDGGFNLYTHAGRVRGL